MGEVRTERANDDLFQRFAKHFNRLRPARTGRDSYFGLLNLRVESFITV